MKQMGEKLDLPGRMTLPWLAFSAQSKAEEKEQPKVKGLVCESDNAFKFKLLIHFSSASVKSVTC